MTDAAAAAAVPDEVDGGITGGPRGPKRYSVETLSAFGASLMTPEARGQIVALIGSTVKRVLGPTNPNILVRDSVEQHGPISVEFGPFAQITDEDMDEIRGALHMVEPSVRARRDSVTVSVDAARLAALWKRRGAGHGAAKPFSIVLVCFLLIGFVVAWMQTPFPTKVVLINTVFPPTVPVLRELGQMLQGNYSASTTT